MRKTLFRIASLFLAFGLSSSLVSSAQSQSGTVTGTLRYTDGTPVVGLWVFTTAVPGSPTRTIGMPVDDMGRYGVNLPTGRYYVKVGGMCQLGVECPINAPVYVFYPGTATPEIAKVITVVGGTNLEGLDFTFTVEQVTELKHAASQLGKQASQLWDLRSSNPAETKRWSSTDEMHKYYVAKFIATPGMGSGRVGPMMLEVDPRKRLFLSKNLNGKTEKETWVVKTLDLIGIAKHESPVVFSRVAHGVYAVNNRELTDFERRSLAELRLGKKIVSETDNGSLLVVGSIRADASCLRCHSSYGVGDLLGAFRYVLHPGTVSPVSVERNP